MPGDVLSSDRDRDLAVAALPRSRTNGARPCP